MKGDQSCLLSLYMENKNNLLIFYRSVVVFLKISSRCFFCSSGVPIMSLLLLPPKYLISLSTSLEIILKTYPWLIKKVCLLCVKYAS